MFELTVLFASDDLVLVDKPSGMATEPDRRGEPSLRDHVAAWLTARGSKEIPHAVSRLDVGVSGVVTFAISDPGKKAAARAKERGAIERRYIALVSGRTPVSGVVDAQIEGRPAQTRFMTVARASTARDGVVGLVLLEPRTGRTHQLRIHAAALGAPIVGDRKYGGPSTIADARGRVHGSGRVLLHAAGVRPIVGLQSDPPGWVLSPIPSEMTGLWSVLDGEAEAWKEAHRCIVGSLPGS